MDDDLGLSDRDKELKKWNAPYIYREYPAHALPRRDAHERPGRGRAARSSTSDGEQARRPGDGLASRIRSRRSTREARAAGGARDRGGRARVHRSAHERARRRPRRPRPTGRPPGIWARSPSGRRPSRAKPRPSRRTMATSPRKTARPGDEPAPPTPTPRWSSGDRPGATRPIARITTPSRSRRATPVDLPRLDRCPLGRRGGDCRRGPPERPHGRTSPASPGRSLPLRVKRVNATSTTATLLVALYQT